MWRSRSRRRVAAGKRLIPRVRRQMERGFGADFKGMRVHTDQGTEAMTEMLKQNNLL
jgi:hypothetical protein